MHRTRTGLFLVIAIALVSATAAPARSPQPDPIAPFVGDWVGTGWGWEVRFKQTRGEFVRQMAGGRLPPGAAGEETIMSLTVKHTTNFVVTVAPDGSISGDGGIVYDLFPNLCGVAALTKQVNEAVDRMDLMPKIFKLATEVGSRSVQRFHADWYDEEAKLAKQIRDIETAAREYEKLGGPMAKAGSSAALKKIETAVLLGLDQPSDVRSLVKAVVMNRCANPSYRVAGTSTSCLALLQRPFEQEIDSAGKIAFDAVLGQTLDRLLDTAKGRMQALNQRSVRESSACAAAPNALRAGTAVGPETLGELAAQMGPAGAAALGEMATGGLPSGLLLSIPGVTQVQYSYKGLSNGPETRRLRIKGRLEPVAGGARMHLQMDGDVGGGDKNLFVEYMVNYKRERHPFPTWSPFIDKPADAHRFGVERVLTRRPTKDGREVSIAEDVVRGTPFATFKDAGRQRNGVRVWHDYEYYWNAHKIMEPGARGR